MSADAVASAASLPVAPSSLSQPNASRSAPVPVTAARLASGLVLAGLAAQVAPVEAEVAEHPLDRPLGDVQTAAAGQRRESPRAPRRVLLTPEPAAASEFCNPIARGADPWVVRHADRYYACEPVTDSAIAVWSSARLTDRGVRQVVWRAPRQGWNSRLIWAPELHRLDDRWYIYYAASTRRDDNAGHRIGVLESAVDDPLGPYLDRGAVYTGDHSDGRTDNRWAIDGTVLELRGRRYLLWSGWPGCVDDQYLYIAPLANPWTTIGPRVRLCENATYVWERVGENPRERGLHEAPQVLQRDGRVFVVYSCSGSWQPTYKLGLLELVGDGDPLNPQNWRKYPRPVFESHGGVCGVGHASFVRSPDDREDWIVYHAKLAATEGWKRVVCTQRFDWTRDGLPDFGRPAPWHTPLAAPAGEPAQAADIAAARPARSTRLRRHDGFARAEIAGRDSNEKSTP